MYTLLRSLLFRLNTETAHYITLNALDTAYRLHLTRYRHIPPTANPCQIMGLHFNNRVGLAAGLDKNGQHIDALGALGFGFIEIGTVTPRPQSGNPQPRLFRLPAAQALINRMGFNNNGVHALQQQAQQHRYTGILGINIGKNADTPPEQAINDYQHCLQQIYTSADYVTVNISSPNTPGLRQLQQQKTLDKLLTALKQTQTHLAEQHGRYVPLAVKIAPDLDNEAVAQIADLLLIHGIDGVIATNTTLSREQVNHLPHGQESGGLSGLPLREKSTQIVMQLSKHLQQRIPIIATGGICSAADAQEKIDAGASLIQLYTGLIYRGPALVQEILASSTH